MTAAYPESDDVALIPTSVAGISSSPRAPFWAPVDGTTAAVAVARACSRRRVVARGLGGGIIVATKRDTALHTRGWSHTFSFVLLFQKFDVKQTADPFAYGDRP